MYSDSNVLQEFQNQTKGLIQQIAANPVPKQQNPNYLQQLKPGTSIPRGVNSLSMGMLALGIQDASAHNSKLFYFNSTKKKNSKT